MASFANTLEIPDPLVGRYLASEGMLPLASEILSEGALYLRYALPIEVALLEVLAEDGWLDQIHLEGVRRAAAAVTLEEFQAEETRVRHDLKALVNVFAARCPAEVRSFIHLGATSYDILANAHLLRLRDGINLVLLPELDRCLHELYRLGQRYAATPQIGRTHGQYAEPMTFGYSMAVYLERLGWCQLELKRSLEGLRGKFSGAVGAYTTPGLIHPDARKIEERVLGKVGLLAASTATQIAHPEPALAVLHHLTAAFGVLANLADDLRHLQRSEINEVAEAYQENAQVGSSAMPHKRNPITWENVKSLWKTFMPQMMTFYLDQVSEHQRDLSNSASARFLPRLILGLTLAGRRTAKGLTTLVVDEQTMVGRLDQLNEVVSGPLQALLSGLGLEDAHEYVRMASVEARRSGRSLLEVAQANAHLAPWLVRLSARQREALSQPQKLCAPAEAACRRALAEWGRRLDLV
ncbi:adenylosuccinate lyase [bacterium]|nr:adenylosuccinate lyase [bacterium]